MAGLIHLPGVAGCDEAGRGPLAGPVVCSAVVLPASFRTDGVRDSKKLSFEQRENAEGWIKGGSDWAIEVVGPEEIDRINILQASLLGMTRSLERLGIVPDLALIDGDRLPPHAPCRCETKVKGDDTYACIAAASILAKNARDRIMVTLHARYPVYGFDKNFGYPTPDHLAALREHGPCPVHRRSYAPVSVLLNQPAFEFGSLEP